ncbi:aromatic-amino-acid transaminase [Devosia enhydra]|uniref:Aminotransferase n=1 Tax=Devosia enhydra TaxID=665118 RepID=A0A1K2HS42_9HYPH|nr:amino acid aminotransferase [Devosia enhydra]SFZ80647.1 aromatic-amino-acid transaminase [Devosia enhydra]
MLEALTAPPPDKILSLMDLFRADTRPERIDLGVGVYRDAQGLTPILDVVRRAEARLDAAATTKAYVGPAGDPRFVELVRDLAFGSDAPVDRLRGIQTTGGAGALRLLAGLIARARPGATVHLPDPTWVNHAALLADAGLKLSRYRYYDPATGGVALENMLEDIAAMASGDVIMLHGCCHNPTGADPSREDWQKIADAIAEREIFAFIDLAYQGFGDGLEADAWATRLLIRTLPQLVVAYSCSKNFGIYRDRAGAAFILARTPAEADIARAQLTVQSRIAYSMPPDHGAALVRDILADPASAALWRADVEAMRNRIASTRAALAAALVSLGHPGLRGLGAQKGMFSLLPLTPAQVARMRETFGIYMVDDGRINLAGLQISQIPVLKRALEAIL